MCVHASEGAIQSLSTSDRYRKTLDASPSACKNIMLGYQTSLKYLHWWFDNLSDATNGDCSQSFFLVAQP
jgi:hypothetical protein